MRTPVRILALTLLLTLVRGALVALSTTQVPALSYLAWLGLADLVIATILLTIAEHSPWRGWRLGLATFGIAFGIGSIGTLVEAVLFRLFPLATVGRLAISALLVGLVLAIAIPLLAGPAAEPPTVRPRSSAGRRLVRVAGGALVYLVCYVAAGIAVLPFVRSFYEHGGGLPSGGSTFAMQLFFRGPLLVLIADLLVRMTTLSRRGHALLVAGAMVGLGGVAPLLVPNPFLPDAVRWAHMIEIATSNAIFGWVVGWIYSGSRDATTVTA